MIDLETGQHRQMPSDSVSDERLKPIVRYLEKIPEGSFALEIKQDLGMGEYDFNDKISRLRKLDIVIPKKEHSRKSGLRGRVYWKLKAYEGTGGWNK